MADPKISTKTGNAQIQKVGHTSGTKGGTNAFAKETNRSAPRELGNK